jgi:hypothetical protein
MNTEQITKGSFIVFNLDVWDSEGNHCLMQVESKVLDICVDPIGICETKCSVEFDGEAYGIPLSEILDFTPANGFQLQLF